MKKLFNIILSCFILLGICACGSNENVYSFKDISAVELVNLLKENDFPIGRTVEYDEKTDPNDLLGRPNEYIEKLDFDDTVALDRAISYEYNGETYKIDVPDDPYGGTIEVFENADDAKARYEYIDSVAHSGPLSTYMYLYDNVLIRIQKDLTPSEAKKYEEFFEKINNGEISKESE